MSGSRRPVWRGYVRVHRLEYPFPVNYLCHAAGGACYGLAAPHSPASPVIVIALVANLIPIVAQNVLNASFDARADARVSGKESIAAATRGLGRRVLLRCAAAEMTTAIALAVIAALLLGSPLVAVLVAAGAVLDLAYNCGPLRLKKRGMANPVTLGLRFGLVPYLAAFLAVSTSVPAWSWLVFLGQAILLTGRTLWWSLPDLHADAAAGDLTPVVRHGPVRALAVAGTLTALGVLATTAGICWRFGPFCGVLAAVTTGALACDVLRHRRQARTGTLPDCTRMRLRTLSLVMIADVVLVVIPLAA